MPLFEDKNINTLKMLEYCFVNELQLKSWEKIGSLEVSVKPIEKSNSDIITNNQTTTEVKNTNVVMVTSVY